MITNTPMNMSTPTLTNMPTGARGTAMNICMATPTNTDIPIHMTEAVIHPVTITPAITVRISMTIKIIRPNRINMGIHEAQWMT